MDVGDTCRLQTGGHNTPSTSQTQFFMHPPIVTLIAHPSLVRSPWPSVVLCVHYQQLIVLYSIVSVLSLFYFILFTNFFIYQYMTTIREESSQTNVIIQYKLLASLMSAVCSVIQQSSIYCISITQYMCINMTVKLPSIRPYPSHSVLCY